MQNFAAAAASPGEGNHHLGGRQNVFFLHIVW